MRLFPRSGAAARLALGMVLCLCCESLLAQSAPPPGAHASATQTAPAALPSPAPAAAQGDSPDHASATPAPADAQTASGNQPPADGSTADVNLSGVRVEGKRNAFTDSDKRLKQLQDSLPCTGCDATPHVKKKFVSRVLSAVGERITPTETPDHSNRDPNDKAQEFSQENDCNGANPGGCVQSNLKP